MNDSYPPRPCITLSAAFETGAAALHSRCVRVAVTEVDEWVAWQDDAWALLDAHEHARASRQRLSHERTRRALAYALHRLILADALGCDPSSVPLYRDTNGCPRLEGDMAWTSLSHAGGLLAFAITRAGPVGVDIEPATRACEMDGIAGSICHADEWASLGRMPDARRALALLELWVRKEAVLKAAGVGLEVPMPSFVARHSAAVRVPGFLEGWRVSNLDLGPQAVAAVAAVEGGEIEHVRLRQRHAPTTRRRSVAAS